MTVRPILFSAPMIRALLEGRKTQTRRVLRDQPEEHGNGECTMRGNRGPTGYVMRGLCPRFWTPYRRGDILWVREAWQFARQEFCSCPQGSEPAPCDDWSEGIGCRSARNGVVFRADGGTASRWRSSIHMPRWASRLTLVVSDVRVQRVQNISEADAIDEGVEAPDIEREDRDLTICRICGGTGLHGAVDANLGYMEVDCQHCDSHYKRFATLWDSINGKRAGCAWADNPWVIALAFAVHRMNVDEYLSRAGAPRPLAEGDTEEPAP